MTSSNEPEANETKSEVQNPPAESKEPTAALADGSTLAAANRRQSAWTSSYEAINYVFSLPRSKLRLIDKTSDILLGLAILLVVLLSFAPTERWQLPLAFICDVVCLVTVIFFLGNRLGILRTLEEKQAVLVWDIAMGALIFGALLAINSMLLIKAILHAPGVM